MTVSCLLSVHRNNAFNSSQSISTDRLNIRMSYLSTTLGGGTDDKYVKLQTPDSVFGYLQGQCYDHQTPIIEPTESNDWGTLHSSGSDLNYQKNAFTPQSSDKDYKNARAGLIPSPPESQNSFSSDPCFSHTNTSSTDDESWKKWFTLKPMSNTATHGVFSGPWDGNCGNTNCYHTNNFFPPPDSTLGDRNIDPSLDSTINLLPPFHVSIPNQQLEQALQFASKPNFPENGLQPHFHYQTLPKNGGLYINQAGSISKEESLVIYGQYDPARGEVKFPLSSHLPRPIERPATSPMVSQSEFTSLSELESSSEFTSPSEFVSPSEFLSQSGLLQNTVPPGGNRPLTTSHTSSSGASHISNTQYFNRQSTYAKRGIRTCSNCLDPSHNIAQCPLRPCRFCGQMGHVSSDCDVRKRKNMDHRRDATRRRRHLAKALKLRKLSSRIKFEKILQEYQPCEPANQEFRS